MGERLMKVATLNVGELKLENDGEDKFKKLCNFLTTQEFHICCLQETHVNGEELRRWSESKDCAYDAYGTKKHWDDPDIELLHQAGAAILIRKNWEKHCIRSDLFTTASVNPAQTALDTHIIAVELTSVKILLVSIYVPPWTNFQKNHQLRFEQFYKPFLECLDKWKVNPVIVAGDMNDYRSFCKNPDWNIFNQLTRKRFDELQGGYFSLNNYIWNYAYFDSELKRLRYDYIFSKNITRVKDEEKAFRVLVRRENQTPIQSQDPVLQLDTISLNDDDLVQSNGKGVYYLPHSLLSSEFKLREPRPDADGLVQDFGKMNIK